MAADILVSAVAAPIAVGLAASFALEVPLLPRPAPLWKRPAAAVALHVGMWLSAFVLMLSVLARPWFAAALVSAFLLLLVVINQAKFHSLREPFLFQDFDYFTDAIRHPRLYLPFLGWSKAVLAASVFLLAICVGFSLEPPLHDSVSRNAFGCAVAAIALLSGSLLWVASRRDLLPVFEPDRDLRRLGLLGSLWSYKCAERVERSLPSPFDFMIPSRPAGSLPHLVVVQSESYFDARRLYPGIRPEILKEWDALRSESVLHGQLAVPAWGANTVRSEFAFLTGLDERRLGVHRFNPYRTLARPGLRSVASFLRRLGYRTVCIHPYPASFYWRDEIYPKLGFDEFIDIRHFHDARRCGPYVSDLAVAEKAAAVLESSGRQPVFVFVITMENHGPLHLETIAPEDISRLYSHPPAESCKELAVYLRHLSNASKMAGALRDTLNGLPDDAWLAWFGDHVPIMPRVYGSLGAPDGQTDYLLWHKNGTSTLDSDRPMRLEELGLVLLREVGLAR